MVHAEQLAHMEAQLLLVLFLIRTLFLRPLDDVLDLGDTHVVFVQNSKDIAVKKTFVEGIDIGLCTQAYALKARSLRCAHALFKAALIAECPRTDCNGMLFAHFDFPPLICGRLCLYRRVGFYTFV